MTETPDLDQPSVQLQAPPQGEPIDDQPMAVVTSETVALDPVPTAPEASGVGSSEVEIETTPATVAHTVAFPGPIPEYTMEPTHPLPPESPHLTPEPPYPVAPTASVPAGGGAVAGAAEPEFPEASVRPRRSPLLGTIIWGVILLALAGYILLGVLIPAPADPTLWLLGGVIVIGLLLIVIGIIAALRRAG